MLIWLYYRAFWGILRHFSVRSGQDMFFFLFVTESYMCEEDFEVERRIVFYTILKDIFIFT